MRRNCAALLQLCSCELESCLRYHLLYSTTAVYGSTRHTTYSGMRLHTAAATTVSLCCLFLRLEAFVTLHEMVRNAGPPSVEIRRSAIHLPTKKQGQKRKQQQQQQHQRQRGGGTGARHNLSCCTSAGAGRTLLLRIPPTGCAIRHKRTALQQQRQQYCSPGDTGGSVFVQQLQRLFHQNPGGTRTSKHRRSESSLARRGMALSAEPGGGGEESNALLLRMDFEGADVEGLRTWIRRCVWCDDVNEHVAKGFWLWVVGT